MRALLLALLGLAALCLPAQTFIRAYSERPFTQPGLLLPEDAIQMSDGSYVFTAYDGYLVQTGADGIPVKTLRLRNTAGGIDSSLNLDYLAQAGPGQVFIAGNTSADTLFLLKLSLDGNVLWQKSYRSPSNSPRALVATPDGGLLVLASTGRGLTQSSIPILTRLDANGNLLWQRRYYNSNLAAGRMNWYDASRAANGDYLVTGTTVPASPSRVLVARISSAGSVLWAKEFAPSNNSNEHGVAVAELASGQIEVVVNNPLPGTQFGRVLLSAAGDLLSAGAYSGGGGNIYRASILADGSALLSLTNLDAGIKLAPDGSPALARSYSLQNGSSVIFNKWLPSSDGGLLGFGGYTFSFFGDFASLMLKTGAEGIVPPGFSSDLTISQLAYSPSLSSASLSDSAYGSLDAGTLRVSGTQLAYDTLFGTPPPLALEAMEPPLFRLSPNPAPEVLRLAYAGEQPAAWRILDLGGRELAAGSLLPGQEARLPLAQLASGHYLCEVRAGSRRQATIFIKP